MDALTIQIDTREKPAAIELIEKHFDKVGVKHFRSKLVVGDYCSLDRPRLAIDRKQNLQEICGNICQGHERFKAEIIRSKELGIQLILLIEHGPSIKTLSDVRHWKNPRLAVSPNALDGYELYRRLSTIQARYDVPIHFCTKHRTGAKIIDILTNNA